MKQYTRGLWKLSPMGREWIVDETGFAIAKVLDGKTGEFNEANAHLIASAPDLYEALKEIVDSYEGIGTSAFMAKMGKSTASFREALTRAEGK